CDQPSMRDSGYSESYCSLVRYRDDAGTGEAGWAPAFRLQPTCDLLGRSVDDEVDGVLHGDEVLHLVVRNLDVELLLSVHDDGHHRDRVDVQVVGECLVELHGLGGDTGLI